MEHKFVSHVMILTLILAFCASLAVGFAQHFFNGIAILLGAGWGITNLYFLKKSLQEWLKIPPRNHLKLFMLLQIKFPFLYFIGYELLHLNIVSIFYFLIGFSLIFLSIFLLGLFNFSSDLGTVLKTRSR